MRIPPVGFGGSWLLLFAMSIAGCGRASAPTTPTALAPAVTQAAPSPTPAVGTTPVGKPSSVSGFSVEPASVVGGATVVGTVGIPAPAPVGGTVVTLASSDRDVRPPESVTVAAGATTAMFLIPTSEPHADTPVRLTATADGISQSVDLMLLLPAPGARSDEYTTAQGGTLVVASPGILDNDARRTGHDLTAELVMGPMSGTLTLRADGGFTYRPNAGISGRDRFIYRALDGKTYSNQQHVWITVTGPPRFADFSVTGAQQNFIVPADVTTVTIEAFGAQGGDGDRTGGAGGFVIATIPVTPGETLAIFVGGQGALRATAGFNGGGVGADPPGLSLAAGGGGGASDVRQGGVGLADRVVVAGGGGGGGTSNSGADGGAGGFTTGANGANAATGGIGGGGGTQIAGGAGGAGVNTADPGLAGTLGVGGAGGSGVDGATNDGGGGGGGGMFGGGGGGGAEFANTGGGGGGGGSSFAIGSATNVVHQQGVRTGNGLVRITW